MRTGQKGPIERDSKQLLKSDDNFINYLVLMTLFLFIARMQ